MDRTPKLAFKAFRSKDAENYLALLQNGDAIICPSSKGTALLLGIMKAIMEFTDEQVDDCLRVAFYITSEG